MMSSISTHNASHYLWAGICDGWHLVKRDDLSVIQERVPPGASETRHLHANARQFFFVLEGQATIEIDDDVAVLNQHEGIEVAPGKAHRFRNDSDRDVVFLVVSCPPSHGDRQNLEA